VHLRYVNVTLCRSRRNDRDGEYKNKARLTLLCVRVSSVSCWYHSAINLQPSVSRWLSPGRENSSLKTLTDCQVCTSLYPFTSTVWVKNPPWGFMAFSPNGWEFLVQILQAYCAFLSTLDYKFLFNYLQLWRSFAILCATTQFTSYAQNLHHRPKRTLGGRTVALNMT